MRKLIVFFLLSIISAGLLADLTPAEKTRLSNYKKQLAKATAASRPELQAKIVTLEAKLLAKAGEAYENVLALKAAYEAASTAFEEAEKALVLVPIQFKKYSDALDKATATATATGDGSAV